MTIRGKRFEKHHKRAIFLAGISLFIVGSFTTMHYLSGESVLAQIRFRIAIRAVPSPLTGICYPLVNTATVGQTVSWIVSPDNGTPPYTYSWSGSESISGSDSFIQKVYTSAGTKTATVIITSEERPSMPILCASSVIVSASASAGSGGGGGGGIIDTKQPVEDVVDKKETLPSLNAAPPEDIKTEISKKDILDAHPECNLPANPTFQDAKNYLVCHNIITQRENERQYEYERSTYRKELLGIATKIYFKSPGAHESTQLSKLNSITTSTLDVPSNSPYHFLDVGIPGQPEWVSQTVNNGLIFGLISKENTHFRPDDLSTRAEAFAMLMKSVCMNPDESVQKKWEQRVYEIALRNGITSRSWQDFKPGDPILRQELFVITARLDLWKDETGGCDRLPLPEKKPTKNISTIIEETYDQLSCFLPDNPTPKEAEKYLFCSNLLSHSDVGDKFNDYTQKITILGLGVEMLLKNKIVNKDTQNISFTLQFLDVCIPGQEPWIEDIVILGVRHGLIRNNTKRYLRPQDYVTRGEALKLLLRSVCLDINESIQATEAEKLYDITYKHGITQLAWEDFDVDELISRGELLVAVSKLNKWKDTTGGCDTYTHLTPKYNVTPLLESAPKEPEKTPQNEVTNIQKPGTFSFLYENEIEKVYTYIVKNGGIPDGVRAQFIRVFGFNKSIASRLKIHDIAGTEFAEDRWLIGGELVYVTVQK